MTRIVAPLAHILALGVWAGTSTFFLGCVALRIFAYFRQLPEHPTPGLPAISSDLATRMAGDLIATIFPTYFAIQAGCGAVALVTGWMLARRTRRDKIRALLVTGILALLGVQIFALYLPSTQIRHEQYAAVDAGETEKAEQLRKRFFALHGPSLLLDAATTALVLAALGMAGPYASAPLTSDDKFR